MSESKIAKLRTIKTHILPFHSTKNTNKVTVITHPKVIINKKQENKGRRRCTKQKSATHLDMGNPFGTTPQGGRARSNWRNLLQVHFAYANAVGAAPYKFDGASLKWQLKGPYLIVNAFALLDNLLIVWGSIQKAVAINSKTEIVLYIDIATNFAYVTLRIVHMISVWRNADKYATIFTVLDDTTYSIEQCGPKKTAFAVVISAMGFIRALSRSLVRITSGAQYMLIGHCSRIMTTMAKDWRVPENIDYSCGALGLIGFLATFSGGIVQQAAFTGCVLASATLLSACKEFKYKEVPQGLLESGPVVNDVNANNASPSSPRIGKRYGELKKISKVINSAFSPILKLLLLANLFMFSSLINNVFNGNIARGTKAWLLFDAALACVFLYLANAIGNTGERFREWLKVDQNRVQVGMSQLDVLQEDGASQSIGIGRGAFFISDGFLLGYAGAIVAYFFGIVETRPLIDADLKMGYANQTALPCECNCYCRGN